jgi:SAM-dependent methyltransferase
MIDHSEQHSVEALVERMRCTSCGGVLRLEGASTTKCTLCSERFDRINGIWRMLTEQQRARFAAFMASYPVQRSREGWERDDSYYLNLPHVAADDPTAPIWRIRRRSLRVLEKQVIRHFENTKGRWALDLGAGNCWLSRRIAKLGFCTVALDLNVDGSDSLSTGTLFMDRDNISFERVQASMDVLPFLDNVFDLCTVSAALYYADVRTTLREAYRALRPNGMLVISDSPIYSHAAPGIEMAGEQRQRLSGVLGSVPADLPGGRGFLVESELLTELRAIGFAVDVLFIEHPLGRVRRQIRSVLRPQRREEAKFPVFRAIKPAR